VGAFIGSGVYDRCVVFYYSRANARGFWLDGISHA